MKKLREVFTVPRLVASLFGLLSASAAFASFSGTATLAVNGSTSANVTSGSTVTLSASISSGSGEIKGIQYFATKNGTTSPITCASQSGSGIYASCLVSNLAAGSYSINYVVDVIDPVYGTAGPKSGTGRSNSVALTVAGPNVILHPKYVILGVTYAPPGTGSSVQYANTSQIGTTLTDSASYLNGSAISVSISGSGGIGGILKGSLTGSVSQTGSQTVSSSTGTTISTTIQSNYRLGGLPLPAANQPTSYYTTISHDYDVIWVWLNPVALYTVQGVGNIKFNGFAYDANNPVGGMDIVPIQVGVLNGHFAVPASLQVAFNRAWEKDVIYAAGDGPAINASDKANILAANPFTNSNYSVAPGASVSADGRFGLTTPYANGSVWQTLSYLPGTLSESFSDTYSSSTTVQSGVSNQRSVTYAIDVSVSGSVAVASFSASLKTSNTQTWTNAANKSTLTSSSSVATVSIVPPANTVVYYGPATFQVYQDNVFGTFMFNPVR